MMNRINNKRLIQIVGPFLILIVLLGIVFRLSTGQGLGVKTKVSAVVSLVKGLWDREAVAQYQKGAYTDIIFLHHSVGRNLIDQGAVREQLTEAGYTFWDHDYNGIGLRDPSGNYRGYSYNVPGDNTDINGMAAIFSQSASDLPFNTLSSLLRHEVIVLKSCFPNSNIQSEEQLAQNKAYYEGMREVMKQHPDRLFVIVTQPPLNPAETNPDAAKRAKALASWLGSVEFTGDQPNIVTFDLFSRLAEDEASAPDYNMLKEAYRDGTDSHPNRTANEAVSPEFVEFLIKAIEDFRLKQ